MLIYFYCHSSDYVDSNDDNEQEKHYDHGTEESLYPRLESLPQKALKEDRKKDEYFNQF